MRHERKRKILLLNSCFFSYLLGLSDSLMQVKPPVRVSIIACDKYMDVVSNW